MSSLLCISNPCSKAQVTWNDIAHEGCYTRDKDGILTVHPKPHTG